MAFEQEITVYRFQAGYAEMLLDGLDADKAFSLICDGGVSPAWIIGHLGFVSNNVASRFGGESKIDLEAWGKLFSGGSTPTADASDYPSWDELLGVYRQGHEVFIATISGIGEDVLSAENPNERMRQGLPTVEDFLSFVATGHVAMHLGQLSTWRRVQGQPPLF
ncbi:DinB family protein [Algisphaera agarilytica]|uniref:DinB-like domain-containing protein n=1 Tax=Algisphaera agarilytica TaxID=1385975 RepID=A0A7X0HAR5_9BACT|nr:DinB family protein [Algisphaera agarilytica]MBB6430945.1 hypothetical protein [Algisphaera agarilytica]